MAQLLPALDPDLYLPLALGVLRRSGMVAFPTETVYGLAASVLSPVGVGRIYEIKGRPEEKSLPLQCPSLDAALEFGFTWTEGGLRLARRFWPGPLTLITDRPETVPGWFSPGSEGIAVRVPDHPIALLLLRAFGIPLAVTSANGSGEPPALGSQSVVDAFPEVEDLLVLDGGASPGGRASTVVDVRGDAPFLLRPGPVSWEAVAETWKG
jgi:L-threonylcarbamoyladenylate synthase